MFHSCTPSAALQPFIKTIWYCNRYVAGEERTRALPFGRMEMVIRFSGDYFIGQEITSRECWITGQQTGAITTTISGQHECMGVVFTSLGWSSFSNTGANELAGNSFDADLLFGHDVNELRNQLAELPTATCKFNVLQEFLLKRLKPVGDRSLVKEALHIIRRDGNSHRVTVYDLSRQLKVSRKTLNHHFQKYIGLPASTYLQQGRFNAVLQHICNAAGDRLVEIGYEYNFFDQAHFIKQFHAFAGMTPGEYARCFKNGSVDGSFPNFIAV